MGNKVLPFNKMANLLRRIKKNNTKIVYLIEGTDEPDIGRYNQVNPRTADD